MSLVCLLAAVLSACDDDPAPRRAAQTPTPTTAQAEACPNAQEAVADPAAQIGRSEHIDVTGDGEPDEVRLHSDRKGPDGCRAFLALESDEVDVVSPVWAIGEQGALTQPSLYGSVDLGDPGAEIILIEAAGASTQFAAMYTLVGDSFELVELPASDNGLFPFGGSVGHIEAVGCDGDEIVVLRAVPGGSLPEAEGQIYEVERRSYVMDDAALEQVDVQTEAVPIDRFDRFPEFSGGPFATCPAP